MAITIARMRSLQFIVIALNPKGNCGKSIVLKSETQGGRHPAHEGLMMEVCVDPYIFISDSDERSLRDASRGIHSLTSPV
jgi:hypothetical protein